MIFIRNIGLQTVTVGNGKPICMVNYRILNDRMQKGAEKILTRVQDINHSS